MVHLRSGLCWALLISSAACGGGGGGGGNTQEPTVVLTNCNPVAQTGCSSGKKCTWLRTTTSGTPAGAMACVPNGAVDLDGACSYGADGTSTGYDNCKRGLVCRASASAPSATGTCSTICDATNPMSCTPSTTLACSGYSGFFANQGTNPTSGLCDAQCNPLTQALLTTGAAACGSPNPASPTLGCYGLPSGTTAPSYFTCATAGSATNTSDVVVNPAYLNACAPGFVPLLLQSTGSSNVICVAYCRPADTTLASHPSPGGQAPYTCAAAGAGGTHECRYWWFFEGATTPLSTWSDGLGFCFDYTKYTYTPTVGPPVTSPSCTTLSDTAHHYDATVSDAAYWGCVAK